MTSHNNFPENEFALDIVSELHRCAKGSDTPGTVYWVVDHNGPGSLRSFRDFIDVDGNHNGRVISPEAAKQCCSTAYDWLLDLRDKKQLLWKMLLCAADSEGNFNIIPIYPDDPRATELDFGPAAGVIKQAPTILEI